MPVLNDWDETIGNGCTDDDQSFETGHEEGIEPIINKSKLVDPACERTPIKDVPTLGSIIGACKSTARYQTPRSMSLWRLINSRSR